MIITMMVHCMISAATSNGYPFLPICSNHDGFSNKWNKILNGVEVAAFILFFNSSFSRANSSESLFVAHHIINSSWQIDGLQFRGKGREQARGEK